MGQAQELMRRITDAVMAGDEKELADCYVENAVAETPDFGKLEGRSEIVKYLQAFSQAFPDFRFESLSELEDGTVAIDEGYLVGTHTGPMTSPTGESIAPPGRGSACGNATSWWSRTGWPLPIGSTSTSRTSTPSSVLKQGAKHLADPQRNGIRCGPEAGRQRSDPG
jgi:ketosteroid isomerase-like protein